MISNIYLKNSQPQHIVQSSFLVCNLTMILYNANAGPKGRPKPLTISARLAILNACPSNSYRR